MSLCQNTKDSYKHDTSTKLERRRISYTKKGWYKITTKGITEEGEKEKYKEIKDFFSCGHWKSKGWYKDRNLYITGFWN